MDKNGSLLCVPVKVTGIGCSFFSSCVLLGESFVLTHAVPVNGDWSCTERRKCPILKAAWQGDSWEDLCCWCTSLRFERFLLLPDFLSQSLLPVSSALLLWEVKLITSVISHTWQGMSSFWPQFDCGWDLFWELHLAKAEAEEEANTCAACSLCSAILMVPCYLHNGWTWLCNPWCCYSFHVITKAVKISC